MMKYNRGLKTHARALRQRMTDAEQTLWSKLRRKQIHGVQFYRQKPVGSYIVDLYAPRAKLVIELDGSQHFEQEHAQRDALRDSYLQGLGLHVLRFDNLQVLHELEAVLGEVARVVGERVNQNQKTNPPQPPFCKGGGESAPTFATRENEGVSTFTTGKNKNDSPFATEESENVPPFEKGGLGGAGTQLDKGLLNVPPFEKGGLGGIYGLSDFPETPEATEASK